MLAVREAHDSMHAEPPAALISIARAAPTKGIECPVSTRTARETTQGDPMAHQQNDLPDNLFTNTLDYCAATIGWNATYAVVFLSTIALLLTVGYLANAATKYMTRRFAGPKSSTPPAQPLPGHRRPGQRVSQARRHSPNQRSARQNLRVHQ